MLKATLASVSVLIILITLLALPIPWPVATEIGTASDGKSTARYYFRGAGIMGVITLDNPWVYASINDAASGDTRVESVWADTPCDGVERLSRALTLPRPECDDASFPTQL